MHAIMKTVNSCVFWQIMQKSWNMCKGWNCSLLLSVIYLLRYQRKLLCRCKYQYLINLTIITQSKYKHLMSNITLVNKNFRISRWQYSLITLYYSNNFPYYRTNYQKLLSWFLAHANVKYLTVKRVRKDEVNEVKQH